MVLMFWAIHALQGGYIHRRASSKVKDQNGFCNREHEAGFNSNRKVGRFGE